MLPGSHPYMTEQKVRCAGQTTGLGEKGSSQALWTSSMEHRELKIWFSHWEVLLPFPLLQTFDDSCRKGCFVSNQSWSACSCSKAKLMLASLLTCTFWKHVSLHICSVSILGKDSDLPPNKLGYQHGGRGGIKGYFIQPQFSIHICFTYYWENFC